MKFKHWKSEKNGKTTHLQIHHLLYLWSCSCNQSKKHYLQMLEDLQEKHKSVNISKHWKKITKQSRKWGDLDSVLLHTRRRRNDEDKKRGQRPTIEGLLLGYFCLRTCWVVAIWDFDDCYSPYDVGGLVLASWSWSNAAWWLEMSIE